MANYYILILLNIITIVGHFVLLSVLWMRTRNNVDNPQKNKVIKCFMAFESFYTPSMLIMFVLNYFVVGLDRTLYFTSFYPILIKVSYFLLWGGLIAAVYAFDKISNYDIVKERLKYRGIPEILMGLTLTTTTILLPVSNQLELYWFLFYNFGLSLPLLAIPIFSYIKMGISHRAFRLTSMFALIGLASHMLGIVMISEFVLFFVPIELEYWMYMFSPIINGIALVSIMVACR